MNPIDTPPLRTPRAGFTLRQTGRTSIGVKILASKAE
jgi:hypothetical protein